MNPPSPIVERPDRRFAAPASSDPAGVKAWLIDLDGTLYRAGPVRAAMALELMGGHWKAMRVVRAFRREHEAQRHAAEEHADGPFLSQVRAAAMRLACREEHVEATVRQWMEQRPGKWLRLFRRRDLLTCIARFRERGGRTTLVSDYPATSKLAALGARELFDVVVANGEPHGPKRLKPCPDGYLIAAERLEVSPSACLVIGDRHDADGEAANRAGMAFHHIRRPLSLLTP